MHPILKRRCLALVGALVAGASCAGSRASHAYVTSLPPSLAHDVLSETVPTAFAPFDLSTSDYGIEWVGSAPEGLKLELLADTIQWVRIADVLALPRARLRVRLEHAEAARVSNAGFSQALVDAPDGALTAEIPVALMSGDRNRIEVAFKRGGRDVVAQARLQFKPGPKLQAQEDRVFYDPSCSRFGVRAEGTAQSSKAKGWAYVGCRIAEVQGAEHRTSSLEAWVYWDGIGQEILVGGVPTPSTSASVWPLRLRADPGRVQLAVPGGPRGGVQDEMVLSYSTPERYYRGSVGVGIGPYWDRFYGNGESISTPALVVTLYGSYFITEGLRLVAFDATTLDSHLTTDFGVYLNTEYARFLDRRIVINLLLGVHAIGFISQGSYRARFGAPQGAEAHIIDFLGKGKNLSSGIFLYPPINGRSYYNAWLRWGSPRFFWELNYISWDEILDGQAFHSTSAGVCVGFPLPFARFD
jgi:hypothetical protein